MEKMRARVLISGKVQGVCFRIATEKEVSRFQKITGWVRNLPTGQVEALFEGDQESIKKLITWCHQGPPSARVTQVEVSREPYQGDFSDFRIV